MSPNGDKKTALSAMNCVPPHKKRTEGKQPPIVEKSDWGLFVMKRDWTNIRMHEEKIREMRTQGKTRQEIADELGLTKQQIKNWIWRSNRKAAREAAGIPPKQRGRKAAVTLEEYKYENKRLKMENELLRDFLRAAGRR